MSFACSSLSASPPPAAASLKPYSDDEFHPFGKSNRAFVNIIHELAQNYGLEFKVSNKNWLLKLTDPLTGIKKRIHGYDMGLNDSSASRICDEKAATSTFLTDEKVANIHHRLFLKEDFVCSPAAAQVGVWDEITQFAEKHKFNLVCKPNSEAGGLNVIHTTTPRELQVTVQKLFEKYDKICLSPYHEIKDEFRVIMLGGEPELIFKKVRPHLIGDGNSTILHLYTTYLEINIGSKKIKATFAALPSDYNRIPSKGEIINLAWKHNLCQGATSEIFELSSNPPPSEETVGSKRKEMATHLEMSHQKVRIVQTASTDQPQSIKVVNQEKDELTKNIMRLAKQAAAAVGVVFASVDIALIPTSDPIQPSLKIMEINNGVMMENFIREHQADGSRRAKIIYEKAICLLFPPKIGPHVLESHKLSHSSAPILAPTSSPASPPREFSLVGASAYSSPSTRTPSFSLSPSTSLVSARATPSPSFLLTSSTTSPITSPTTSPTTTPEKKIFRGSPRPSISNLSRSILFPSFSSDPGKSSFIASSSSSPTPSSQGSLSSQISSGSSAFSNE